MPTYDRGGSDTGGSPLYRTVKHELLNKIKSGQLTAGDLLPSEKKLAAEFECSRLTVHRALREMAEEGYVVRRRRAGTRVAEQDTVGIVLQIPRTDEEIKSLGFVYRYELLKRRFIKPPAKISTSLETDPEQRLLNITCRHWAGKRIYQHENRWINTDVVPAAKDQCFTSFGPNFWLLKEVPFSDAELDISAIVASKMLAGLLLVSKGSPLLQIKRRTTSQNNRVTCVTLLHPGDLYVLRSCAETN